jgi:hypothetical protein
VRAVFLQQGIQTFLGWLWVDASENSLLIDHSQAMKDLRPIVSGTLQIFIGRKMTQHALDVHEPALEFVLYWWLIPIAQFLFAL